MQTTDPTMPENRRENMPGTVLRARREAKGLSREEVAERLHLDLKIINALEEDNHHKLPGHAYVMGYLRSYARLLGIPEQEVLAQLQSDKELETDLLPPNVNYKPEPVRFSVAMVFLAVIIIALLAAGITFWLNNETAKPELASTTESTTVIEETIPIPETAATTGETIPEPQQPPVETTATTSPAAAPSEPAVPKATAKASQAPAVVTKPGADLVLHYNEDSWTEIYDADGKRLQYGMVNKGEKLDVEGKQPFSVLLGNAPGVVVEFRGKKFDHTRFIRNDVAQFVIGSSRYN